MLTPSLETVTVLNNIDEIEQIYKGLAVNTKRARQATIGASELGTNCQRCLAYKLAKTPTTNPTMFNYPAWQGTAQHLWLEKNFKKYDPERFLTEKRIKIGHLTGHGTIWGNVDLYDQKTRMCIDWKFLGDTNLKKYATHMRPQYETQAHLYGYGLRKAGFECETVAICMLPRTKPTFNDRKWWWAVYDEDKALQALQRAENILLHIRQAKKTGDLDEYFQSLPTGQGCFTCQNYTQYETQ